MDRQKKRDELVFLKDILECIEKIEEYVSNLTEKEIEEIINEMLCSICQQKIDLSFMAILLK